MSKVTVFGPLVLDKSTGPFELADANLRFLKLSSQAAPVNSKVFDKRSRLAFWFSPLIVSGRAWVLIVILRSTDPERPLSVLPLSPAATILPLTVISLILLSWSAATNSLQLDTSFWASTATVDEADVAALVSRRVRLARLESSELDDFWVLSDEFSWLSVWLTLSEWFSTDDSETDSSDSFAVSACVFAVSPVDASAEVVTLGVKSSVADADVSADAETTDVGSVCCVAVVEVVTKLLESSPVTDASGVTGVSVLASSSACAPCAANSAVPKSTEQTPIEYFLKEKRWRRLKKSFIS